MCASRSLIVAAAFAVLSCISLPVAAAPGDTLYTQPGTLVSVHGRSINFYCEGTGAPTVVFDAGYEDWSPAWAIAQPKIASFTRACSYDRPGSGFSDPGVFPRTSVQIARDLHDALHAGNIQGPYLLVGHSFGSYNIRTFNDEFPQDVAAMVIVDGENADVESPSAQRESDKEIRSFMPIFARCRNAIVTGAPLPRVRFSSNGSKIQCNKILFRRMPDPAFSPELNAYIDRVSRTQIPLWDELISEGSEMPADERYLQANVHPLGRKPLYVLTALYNYRNAHLPTKQRQQLEADVKENATAQARWLKLSSNAHQWFAPTSGHYIELEDPSLVIRAVKAAVHTVRATSPIR